MTMEPNSLMPLSIGRSALKRERELANKRLRALINESTKENLMSNTVMKIAMPSNFTELPPVPGAVNLNLTPIEHVMVRRIAERIANEVNAALKGSPGAGLIRDHFSDILNVSLAIAACHLNGCPLALEEMMRTWHRQAFVDDVMGIFYNLDRSTGKLTNGFRPMFVKGS